MAKPNSRTTLIDYCLRSLGAPVIEINVDEDQIEDRIDEAFQFYNTFHADAIEKVFLKHQVTGSTLALSASVAENFTVGETITGGTSGATAVVHNSSTGSNLVYSSLGDSNTPFQVNEVVTGGTSGTTGTISTINLGDIENGYVPTPDLVKQVSRVFPFNDTHTTDMFSIDYQLHLNDIYSLGFMGNLSEYYMTQSWLSLLDLIVDTDNKHIDFNVHRNTLRIDMDWKAEVAIGSYIIVECERVLDPDAYTDVYNDYFLKRYATALIKMQWGINLSKFEGMVMPGGVTFNGRQILEDAKEEIKELTEEARLVWEDPIDFITG